MPSMQGVRGMRDGKVLRKRTPCISRDAGLQDNKIATGRIVHARDQMAHHADILKSIP